MAEPKNDIELSASATNDKQLDTRQVDVAAAYLQDTETYEPLSAAEERKMVRKTDWILLPMVSTIVLSVNRPRQKAY